MLLGRNFAPASVFFAAAIPMLLAGAAVALMGWIYRTDTKPERPRLLA
jgi:hypothetical protein